MKVRELAFELAKLTLDGHGDDDVFLSDDDEGNGFRLVQQVQLTTIEEMEEQDLWIEEPRPNDADHVVLW